MITLYALKYSIQERMAFVKMMSLVLISDRIVIHKELQLITILGEHLNFDTSIIEQSHHLHIDQSFLILNTMNHHKKKILGQVLNEVANSNDFLPNNELTLLLALLSSIGIGTKHILKDF